MRLFKSGQIETNQVPGLREDLIVHLAKPEINEYAKILEVRPFNSTTSNYILEVNYEEECYFFNLKDLTARNHAYVKLDEKPENSYVDCYNNIIHFTENWFCKSIDLDNAMQTIC